MGVESMAAQPQQQHEAPPSSSSIVCPRRRREDEAEETGDGSERRHLDGVEMSRHCTDWPRTLDQRAKWYIALACPGASLPALHA
jgi:hypothetical protein